MTRFPSDGNWTADEGFRAMCSALAPPEVVALALDALLPIFTPEWGRAMHAGELASAPEVLGYPCMVCFTFPGGVRQLIELGLALAVIGPPNELTHDLTTPKRFRSRSREIMAAAYLRALGAQLTFIPEGPGPMRPEFTATLDGSTVCVEVKGLDVGAREFLYLAAMIHVMRRLYETQASLPTSLASDVHFRLGAQALASIVRDGQVAADAADRIAFTLGVEWTRVVDEQAAPGSRPGPENTTIIVRAADPDRGHHFMILDILPGPESYVGRLRKRLVSAANKFEAHRVPGVIVLEPPPLAIQWSDEVVTTLARRLRGDHSWTEHVAAIVLTETISFAPHREALEHGSDLRILRGKRWAALPRRLQERWGVLYSHGEHSHDHFDLISLMRKVI